MNKTEADCIWVILKKVGPTFFRFMTNSWTKVLSAQNHLVCDVMIIFSVKEFHITIFEFCTSD